MSRRPRNEEERRQVTYFSLLFVFLSMSFYQFFPLHDNICYNCEYEFGVRYYSHKAIYEYHSATFH
jgi:hypothetical protein